ncbi:hypothetical protein HY493_00060 [Candidatus Woesearchaeota archaeon]|nr:hypothetical protein [Candidatus Woesearchaeota archaeon]
MPLEDRLEGVQTNTANLLRALTALPPGGEPKYLKYHLTGAIVKGCANRGITLGKGFEAKLDQLTKEPLKVVYYGMTRANRVPADVINLLEDWEKVYFFAGIDRDLALPATLDARQIVATTVTHGIQNLCIRHNTFKTRAPSYHHREYVTKPTVPFASEIGTACRAILQEPARQTRAQQDYLAFLLEKGTLTDGEEDSLSCMIDRQSEQGRKDLIERYGPAKFGMYALPPEALTQHL